MNAHRILKRLLGIFLASVVFSTSAYAVPVVQDVTAGMANDTPTLVSFVTGFTHTNSCGFKMQGDTAPGADGYYYNDTSLTGADFTVSADNVNIATFDLTALSFTNFSATASYSFTITGTYPNDTTVQTTFTAYGTILTAGNYAAFTGIKKFRVQFDSTSTNNVSNITFDSFTIDNAAGPGTNTAPVLEGTFTTTGTVNDNATTTPFSSVTVSDVDGDNVSVTINYPAANGTLSGTGVTGSAGNYTVTSAAPATATTNLQGLVFTPTANQVVPGGTVVTAFTLTPNDGTTNGTANSSTQITATSINDVPVITSNGGAATAAINVNENSTAVTTVTKADADTGQSYAFSITGGADALLFNINSSTGVLVFASAPNFEVPTDSGANNIYDVQVTVSDGTATDAQDIAVTVNNVNENPVITSDGGSASASVNAAENQTAVTTVTAIDQDTADTLIYSISGGADSALFNIISSTGVLTFASAPNFEVPTDSGANNVYDVQVTVTDNGTGNLTDVQAIAVTVTNVNEAPVITSNGAGATAATAINENTTAVTTVTATDVDAASVLTYSISGGADAGLFSINSSTGALVFASAPNFELAADAGANNVYDVQVTVTDNGTGNLTDVQDIAVTVNNVNENPVITSDGGGASASVNAAENQTAVTTVTAIDQDTADTLIYSISGGADQLKFTINGSTGVLTFLAAPDFEIPGDIGADNIYDVQVTASDSVLTDMQAIAVSVTDVYDTDSDSDTVYDNADNCPLNANLDQLDSDGDSMGDTCDAFPLDPDNDIDNDTISGHIDNCPLIANLDQLDSDGDGMGDVCDAFVNNDLNTTPSVTAPAGASTFINGDGNNEVATTQPDGTVTAAITYPSDGTTEHSVTQPDGTVTSARFMAPGADIVISDNGDVNSSVQVNGVYVNVQATSDGNTTHQLSIEINGTIVTTEATVGFGGAYTLVDADGSIETNATLADVNGTLINYVINAEINGSSSYRVHGGDFNTTVYSSVPGAATYLGADGNITLATPALNLNGNMVEAIVTTNAQGESYTYFRVTRPDLSVITTPTLNIINRFEPGNSVTINDFDGFYEFIVQAPLNAPLLF